MGYPIKEQESQSLLETRRGAAVYGYHLVWVINSNTKKKKGFTFSMDGKSFSEALRASALPVLKKVLKDIPHFHN